MKITQNGNINPDLIRWNNQMHQKHPIPYYGIVGIIMRARIRAVLKFAEINCVANAKNKPILDYLNADKMHLKFV